MKNFFKKQSYQYNISDGYYDLHRAVTDDHMADLKQFAFIALCMAVAIILMSAK